MPRSLRQMKFPKAGFLNFASRFPLDSHHVTNYVFIILLLVFVTGASDAGAVEGEHPMNPLRPCPSSPNCVSSQAVDPSQRMAPIPFYGSEEVAQARLRTIIRTIPRAEITLEQPGFIAVSFRSRVFGFLDDAEFVFDGAGGMIHFRSGARTGYYDFGVNRSRIERIVAAFATTER
jgi:uncharacterized protein (DUF1499 family)